MDLDEQAGHLEKLQFELQAAGYGAEQVADGPKSVLLDVWHPARPARRLTVHVTARRDGELVFLSSLGSRSENVAPQEAMAELAHYALGRPR